VLRFQLLVSKKQTRAFGEKLVNQIIAKNGKYCTYMVKYLIPFN